MGDDDRHFTGSAVLYTPLNEFSGTYALITRIE